MGATDSVYEHRCMGLDRANWQEQHGHDWEWDREGDYKRLKNKLTGQQLDQYTIHLPSTTSYTKYLHHTTLRNQTNTLIQIHNINKETVKQLCFHSYTLHVYIKHIYLRLADIKDIQYPDNVYVLRRVLQGMQVLYQAVGAFRVCENMVCIDQEGVVKVWCNGNLAAMEPEGEGDGLWRTRGVRHDQDSMIWDIIGMVDSATSVATVPNGFGFARFLHREHCSSQYSLHHGGQHSSQHGLDHGSLTFTDVLQNLQNYISETMIRVPDYFQTAVRVIRQRKGIFDSDIDLTITKPKAVDLQSAIMRGKFKQSQVERVQGFHNLTLKSYISDSNNTFADKLRLYEHRHYEHGHYEHGHYEHGQYEHGHLHGKASGNTNSNISGLKQSPSKQSGQSAIFNLHKPHTQNLISNMISQVSTPPGSQSHTILGHPFLQGPLVASYKNSQHTCNQREQLPGSVAGQTYFSQYMGHVGKGQGGKGQGVTSLMSSRVGSDCHRVQRWGGYGQKPVVKFTYNCVPTSGQVLGQMHGSGQVSGQTSPRQSILSNQDSQSSVPNFNFLPVSPPTVSPLQSSAHKKQEMLGEGWMGQQIRNGFVGRLHSFKSEEDIGDTGDGNYKYYGGGMKRKVEGQERVERVEGAGGKQMAAKGQTQSQVQLQPHAHTHTLAPPPAHTNTRAARPSLPTPHPPTPQRPPISSSQMHQFLHSTRLTLDPQILLDLLHFHQHQHP